MRIAIADPSLMPQRSTFEDALTDAAVTSWRERRNEHAFLADFKDAGATVWYRYLGSDGRGEPSALPFGTLDNVVMTPNPSGVTAETFRGRGREIADNVIRLSKIEPLKNVVIS